jgi:hypothetical protein
MSDAMLCIGCCQPPEAQQIQLTTPDAMFDPVLLQDGEVAVRLAEWLADLMRWAATQPRPLAFLATCKAAAALSPVLRTAGGFDQEVKLPAAGAAGRSSMLAAGVRARGWRCEGEVLQVSDTGRWWWCMRTPVGRCACAGMSAVYTGGVVAFGRYCVWYGPLWAN